MSPMTMLFWRRNCLPKKAKKRIGPTIAARRKTEVKTYFDNSGDESDSEEEEEPTKKKKQVVSSESDWSDNDEPKKKKQLKRKHKESSSDEDSPDESSRPRKEAKTAEDIRAKRKAKNEIAKQRAKIAARNKGISPKKKRKEEKRKTEEASTSRKVRQSKKSPSKRRSASAANVDMRESSSDSDVDAFLVKNEARSGDIRGSGDIRVRDDLFNDNGKVSDLW